MNTTLSEAIRDGDPERVRGLLSMSSHDDDTLTDAWKLAGELGLVAVLEVLCDVDASAPRHRGEAALRAASSADHQDAVEFLLRQGVSETARVPVGAPATAHVRRLDPHAPVSRGTSSTVMTWIIVVGIGVVVIAAATFILANAR